ncbi:aminomethyltransferase family protein [Xanthobacter sp. V2C-8]|uniref:aminomethyltransferase family protein n=1 Tax=Xanthobacter albus TaxID=3119929 RepID=UPI0037279795
MTTGIPAYSRVSALADRHLALGTTFEASWNDMPVPQNYATNPDDEVIAVRTAAGLFDVSALRIIDVSGADALAVLEGLFTSDIARIAPGASSLTSVLDEHGSLIDDVLVYCDGPNAYRISHGGGSLEDILPAVAAGRDVTFRRDDDVHVLSFQGPKALDILAPHTGFDLNTLHYFGHRRTTLFGRAVSMARGGYSGERGYEVLCAAADAVALWDAILAAGRPHGAMAVSWSCLDIVRVEGGLLFFPYDMPEGDTTPWEVGLGWTVNPDKPAFRGREAVLRRRGQERVAQAGLEIDHHAAVEPGARLFRDGEEVGIVNSTAYSRYLMRSLALVHVRPELSAFGTELEVRGADGTFAARVVKTPFYDPLRLRTHPLEERTA